MILFSLSFSLSLSLSFSLSPRGGIDDIYMKPDLDFIDTNFSLSLSLSLFLSLSSIGGIDGIHMKPGSKVLYLGAAAGTTVSHVSDIVGPTGCVYAVEFAHRLVSLSLSLSLSLSCV
jgi:hypothetical protein